MTSLYINMDGSFRFEQPQADSDGKVKPLVRMSKFHRLPPCDGGDPTALKITSHVFRLVRPEPINGVYVYEEM